MPQIKKRELAHVEMNVLIDGKKFGKVYVDRNGVQWKATRKRKWMKRSWKDFDQWITA